VLAASPLLSVSVLARALSCMVEDASGMLDELTRLAVVADVTGTTGRGTRHLYVLRRLIRIHAETTAARWRTMGGPRSRRLVSRLVLADLACATPWRDLRSVCNAPSVSMFQRARPYPTLRKRSATPSM